MTGRKPVPTALKLLRGNPGKRAIRRDEPTPPPLAVACPAELADAEAAAEWARTIAPAIGIGQIAATDRVLAVAHCELWALWRVQLAKAARQKPGVPLAASMRHAAHKTLQLLVKVDSELGLTPVSRGRVVVHRAEGGSDDVELARILAID